MLQNTEIQNTRIFVCCYDFGAAEQITCWLNSVVFRKTAELYLNFEGPAKNLLSNVAHSYSIFDTDEFEIIYQSGENSADDVLICGSGWQTHFEQRWINDGLARGIDTYVVFDRLVNVAERLSLISDIKSLNAIYFHNLDEITAFRKIKFKTIIKVRDWKMSYYKSVYAAYSSSTVIPATELNILFLSEPIRLEEYKHCVYNITKILADIFKEILVNSAISRIKLTIKCHPSENIDTYKKLFQKFEYQFDFSNERLERLLCQNNLILGIYSSSLSVGICLGINSFSIAENMKLPTEFCPKSVAQWSVKEWMKH